MFERELDQLARQHRLRRLRVVEPGEGPVLHVDGRRVILLASNDYLGLSAHPLLKKAAHDATDRYGVGAGASRLISGTLPPHVALEGKLAEFKQAEAALVFGSGYLANVGLIPALVGPQDLILADRLCHASLIDGCRLSGARLRIFRHGDVAQVQRLLSRRPGRQRALLVTEGIFSMDGDGGPLPELAALSERYEVPLLVDDAHGTGVMGAHGRGTLEHYGLAGRLPFHMGTLSKALGTTGAYVVGQAALIEYLLNTARSFIYSTAPPPASAAAACVAIDLVQTEPQRLARLWANRDYFHRGLADLGYRLTATISPILPIVIGDPRQTLRLSERLFELGIFAPAIRPPTVPRDTSRIRTTVMADHTQDQLDTALAAFAQAGRELGVLE